MNQAKQRSLGALLGYVYIALQSVVSLIYIPLLINGIGDGEYGLYQIMGSILAYFAVMETPMSAAIMRFYAEFIGKGEEEKAENTLALGKRINLVLSLIMLVIAVPVTFVIQAVFRSSLPPSELTESVWMFAIMVVNLIITMNNYVYIAAINTHERFVFIKSLSIVSQILQPICVYFLIKGFPYAITIIVVQTVLNIVLSLIRRFYATKKMRVKMKYHGFDKPLVKKMVGLSLSVLFVSLADQIFWRTDQIILGQKFGTVLTAVYSVGAQFNTMYISAGCVVAGVVLPMISRIIATEGQEERLSSFFAKFGRIQAFILCLLLSGVILFGREFINILAGSDYQETYYVALLLMIPYTIDLLQNAGNSILQLQDKYKYRSIVMFVMAILNVVLTIVFVNLWGMVGAALATCVAIVIGSGILMNCIYKKQGIDIKKFWLNVLPILLIAVPTAFLGSFINRITLSNAYLQFFVHVILYVILYGAVMLLLGLKREERNVFKNKLKQFRKNKN